MNPTSSRPSQRAQLLTFASLAVLLVLIRSFVPLWYEGYDFDSDEAVVGLMAKHLTELRAFPLFVYGQHYILGVQAWVAAPFFLLGGPTVFMLRVPMVLWNVALAVLVLTMLVRETRLSPSLAFVAALPFILPAPMTASRLLETLGYSVEPILYVVLLWVVRRRPILFGVVLTIGFLHREFTAYALPALAVVMLFERTLFTRQTLERLLTVIVVGAGIWTAVDVLKGRVDVLGPSSGPIENAPLSAQMELVAQHLCFEPRMLAARFRSLWGDCLSTLFGARSFPLGDYSIYSNLQVGSSVIGWLLGAAAALIAIRLVVIVRKHGVSGTMSLPVYLALVGATAAIAYPFACDVQPGLPGIIRYVLLVLLLPVGVLALYLKHEPSKPLRAVVASAIVVWSAFNLVDNVRVLREYANPPAFNRRQLADYLVAHNIKYSRADYWDAYIVDFLSRERVFVASTWKIRVREYQREVEEHANVAADIVRMPCSGGTRLGPWCIQMKER